ncbi:MAG: glycine/betaine ABC transporter substrate-binding protein, partial [Gammaproteobacteria bacterium HGW-Gammaproteobacteria-9]
AQESQLMEPIMAREDAKAVARRWLKDNPQDLSRLLAGVSTFDGQDGIAAVRAALD